MNININFQLIRAKRRTIQLAIEKDGAVVVRAPRWVALSEIHDFVASKQKWLTKKLAEQAAIPKFELNHIDEGTSLLYLGQPYTLRWSNEPTIVAEEMLHFPIKWKENAKHHLMSWYRHEAKSILPQRITHYANIMQANYSRIRITQAKTRWGSCSSKGVLSFTWKLIMAPLEVIDYIVVHELCHLEHHNHSKRFWDKVESYMPDYRHHEKWLKQHDGILRIDL